MVSVGRSYTGHTLHTVTLDLATVDEYSTGSQVELAGGDGGKNIAEVVTKVFSFRFNSVSIFRRKTLLGSTGR